MEIFLISLLTVFASIVGTLTGFGSSTIMVPVIVLFLPLPVALLFVGIIHIFNDLWKIVLFKKGFNLKLFLTFGIPGIFATFFGAKIVLSKPPEILTQALGGLLLAYAVFLFFKPKLEIPKSSFFTSIGGFVSGFLAGIFGIGGAVRGMFLSTFNLQKEVYLFTSGAVAILIDATRLATYLLGGISLDKNLAYGLLIFVPASFLGAEIAKKIVNKIPQDKFRLIIGVFLSLVGLKLLLLP